MDKKNCQKFYLFGNDRNTFNTKAEVIVTSHEVYLDKFCDECHKDPVSLRVESVNTTIINLK